MMRCRSSVGGKPEGAGRLARDPDLEEYFVVLLQPGNLSERVMRVGWEEGKIKCIVIENDRA